MPYRLLALIVALLVGVPRSHADDTYTLNILMGGLVGFVQLGDEVLVLAGDHAGHQAVISVDSEFVVESTPPLAAMKGCHFGRSSSRPSFVLDSHELTLDVSTSSDLKLARASIDEPKPCDPSQLACDAPDPIYLQAASLNWLPRISRLAQKANGQRHPLKSSFVQGQCSDCEGLDARWLLTSGTVSVGELWKDANAEFAVYPIVYKDDSNTDVEVRKAAVPQYVAVALAVEGDATFRWIPMQGSVAPRLDLKVRGAPGSVVTVFLENRPIQCDAGGHFALHYDLLQSVPTKKPTFPFPGTLNAQCSPAEYDYP
jgi:hypothetical protein